MLRFTALCLFLACAPANAESLESYPGWTMEKIQPPADGTMTARPDYYGLTPPDKRPPISIDGRTAQGLRAGQLSPENVYKGAAAKPEAEPEEFVYGAQNNGWVKADTVKFTTSFPDAESESGERDSSGGSSSFPSPSSVAQSNSFPASAASSNMAANTPSYLPPTNSSGSSSAPGLPVAAAPTALSDAQLQKATDEARGQAAIYQEYARNAATSVNAGGSRIDDGMTFGEVAAYRNPAQTSTVTNTNTTTVTSTGTSTSTQTAALTETCVGAKRSFTGSGVLRVPAGCQTLTITMWGGGGGSGLRMITVTNVRDEQGDAYRSSRTTGYGGDFASAAGTFDARSYDLYIVVGDGGEGSQVSSIKTDNITAGRASAVYLVPKDSGSAFSGEQSGLLLTAAGGKSGSKAGGKISGNGILANQSHASGTAGRAAMPNHPDRGNAGDPTRNGKVVVEYQ